MENLSETAPLEEDMALKERRKTWTEDLAVWEKRFCLWGMTLLVATATVEIVEMSSSIQIYKAELVLAKAIGLRNADSIVRLDDHLQTLRLKVNDHKNDIANLKLRYPKRRIEKIPYGEDL